MTFSTTEILRQYDTESGIGSAYIFAAPWKEVILAIFFGFEKVKSHPGLLCNGLDLEKDNSIIKSFERRVISSYNSMTNQTNSKVKKILDLGCGLGGATFLLANKYPDVIFEGITLSAEQAAQAKSKAKRFNISNTKYYSGNYLSTKFLPNSYDGIMATETFCYIPIDKKAQLAKEVFRLLKPGARIVISDGYLTTKGLNSIENNPQTLAKFRDIATGWGLPVRLSLLSETIAAFEKTGLQLISKQNQNKRILQFSKFVKKRAITVLPFVKMFMYLDKIFQFSNHIKARLGFTSDLIYKFANTSIQQANVFMNNDIEYFQLVFVKPKS